MKTKEKEPQVQRMIQASPETITPMLAKSWLQKNEINRKINEPHVTQLVREMKAGNFRVNGDTIKFGKDGRLLDGQHRLTAVVKSGVTIKSYVLRNLSNDSFKFIDIGRNRTAGDVLSIEGITNATTMAAMAKFIISYRSGAYAQAIGISSNRGAKKVTNFDVSEFISNHKKSMVESYEFGNNRRANLLVTSTVISSLHYIFKKLDHEKANEFCQSFSDGVNLAKTSPIYALRERFIVNERKKYKMPNYEKVALIIKAWNAFRSNKPTKSITFDKVKENFPKPI